MSSVADARAATLYSYIVAPSIVVLYYDYFLTLPREIEYVWSRGFTRVSILFYLNRYPSMIFEIAAFIFTFGSVGGIDSTCRNVNLATQILLIFNQVVVGFILALRTSALYLNTRKIVIFLVLCAAVLVAIACWPMFYRTGYTIKHVPTVQGCTMALDPQTAVHIAVPWEALAAFDIVVFCLTIRHTLLLRRAEKRGAVLRGAGLHDLIFRDGAIYFLTMIIVNVANILIFLLAQFFVVVR
ncbi:hypothetical protein K488DRAFT_84667 [Vararia minispora EC-137]|uniref:Uncharacterized protein n=1 Tax=Vararia minispora EC-137 TaxID=1314806 RepID=A0ACB8QQE1_9AGAM|nr:hypothetical protein K488DRAFT_84667 [Vararia minispora EC-137]